MPILTTNTIYLPTFDKRSNFYWNKKPVNKRGNNIAAVTIATTVTGSISTRFLSGLFTGVVPQNKKFINKNIIYSNFFVFSLRKVIKQQQSPHLKILPHQPEEY